MIYYFWLFMCDTLLCIHVYFHALNYISVIVIFMSYVTCVLNTLIFIYVMSLHYAHLVCFRVFTPMQMSFISCTHAYFISIEYIVLAWVI